MNADLTCSICGGSGERVYGPAEWCVLCNGTGRRPPKLAEWDALKAERDRLRRVIERYGQHDGNCAIEVADGPCDCGFEACLYPAVGAVEWNDEARAALDSDPDLAERTRRIKADE